MLTYGDGVADINLDALLEFHKKHGKMATVTGVNPTSRFGEMRVEGERVVIFSEKPKNAKSFVNGGFLVLDRKIFQFLDESEQCDFEIGALERAASMGELMVYKHPGFWASMDTLRDVDFLNHLWNDNKAPWKTW
jgi:glucose-1-phosphate cytidylyltransferase